MDGVWDAVGDSMWLVVFAGLPMVGTVAAALAYRMRERARWAAVVAVLRGSPGGARVRFTARDGQGRATSQWEITVPEPGGAGAGDGRRR